MNAELQELQAALRDTAEQQAAQFAELEAIIIRRRDEPGFRERALAAFHEFELATGTHLPALHEAAQEPAPAAAEWDWDAYLTKIAQSWCGLEWESPAAAVERAEQLTDQYVEDKIAIPVELVPRWRAYVRAFSARAN